MIKKLQKHYYSGNLILSEVVLDILALINPNNVSEIVAELEPEIYKAILEVEFTNMRSRDMEKMRLAENGAKILREYLCIDS